MANRWLDTVVAGLRAVAQAARQAPASPSRQSPSQPSRSPRPAGSARTTTKQGAHVALPDFEQRLTPIYAPDLDGDADPGEIVWTWVPYEDDPSQGKDRPVLVVGRDGAHLLGLMLTSKDHDRNAEREARHGRYWMDIGSGDWDAKRRDSEVRLDRVLRIDPAEVRREGAVMPRALFDEVVASLIEVKGW